MHTTTEGTSKVTTDAGGKRRVTRRTAARTLVGLLAATALLLTTSTPASATVDATSGKPGAVTTYVAQGSGVGEVISVHGPYAWRSPGTSTAVAQTAWVRYQLASSYAGVLQYGWYKATIPAGAQGVWLTGLTVDVTSLIGPNRVASFSLGIEVQWSTGNTWLGTRSRLYNAASDYNCSAGPQISSANNCFPGNPGIVYWI